jgi:hypothetical protein
VHDDDVYEPGSPCPLYLFERWCRGSVELAVLRFEVPTLLFADGDELDEPLLEQWQLSGTVSEPAELLRHLVPGIATRHHASQVGVSIPCGGDGPGVFLLTIDETGVIAERANVFVEAEHLELGPWGPAGTEQLPVSSWQHLLAANAGYAEFAKWRCRRCRSVCPGEAALVPAPCDFCGSDDIERVPLGTPLAPPAPPYDQRRFDALVEALLGVSDVRNR